MQTLSGTMWKLIEASAFDEEGHELASPLGPVPIGFAIFEAERMMVAVVDGRSSLPADVTSRAFVAYSGRYTFDGTVLVTNVDSRSSPDLVEQQVRHVCFESPTRISVSPKNDVLGRDAGLKFVWERVG